jgi:hypothetical protein
MFDFQLCAHSSIIQAQAVLAFSSMKYWKQLIQAICSSSSFGKHLKIWSASSTITLHLCKIEVRIVRFDVDGSLLYLQTCYYKEATYFWQERESPLKNVIRKSNVRCGRLMGETLNANSRGLHLSFE